MMKSDKKKHLFICYTPYHIFSAVSIIIHEKLCADAIIANNFYNAEEMASNVCKKNIFRRVYFVQNGTGLYKVHGIKGRIKNRFNDSKLFMHLLNTYRKVNRVPYACLKYLFIKKDYKSELFDIDENYDVLYSSACSLPFETLIFFQKYRKNMRYYYYDDGLGTYCDPNAFRNYEQFPRFYFFDLKYTAKVYDPQLLIMLRKKPKRLKVIEQLPIITPSNDNDELIKMIFGDKVQCNITQRVILIDSIRYEIFGSKGMQLNSKLFSLAAKAAGKDNYIYKYHPRDDKADLSLPHIKDMSIPFETFCYWNDLSEKVLITVYSTAVFTPKMMFGQEPIVILLYKLLKNYFSIKINIDDSVFESLASRYINRSKVYIPETVDEYKDILKKLKDNE